MSAVPSNTKASSRCRGAAGMLLCLLGTQATLLRSQAPAAPHWVGSWSAAACAPAEAEPRHEQMALHNTTVRQIVHLTAGGLAVRLRFSNVFGSAPLTLRDVRVALSAGQGTIDSGTDVAVTAGGKTEFAVPPGKSVYTDAASLPTSSAGDIAVSFYVPDRVTAPAVHYTALETSYTAEGEQSGAAQLANPNKITLRLILTGVDVASRTTPFAIVALGSSTTDGAHSTPNANHRWTDDLYARLAAAQGADAPAVLNAGISGNRVLHDGRGEWGPVWGEAAVKRFNRDVLMQSGVGCVIAFEGGNDIRQPGSGAIPLEETVSAEQLTAAFRLMAQAAHQHGLKFIAGTITPFEHADANRAENPLWETTRLAFNDWVRHTHDIDGVVDFDAAIRDPNHPARILARYDSGDHLHPNDAGYRAMAESIDLSLFSKQTATTPRSNS